MKKFHISSFTALQLLCAVMIAIHCSAKNVEKAYLSPFGKAVHELLTTSKSLDKVYNLHFTKKEAKEAFYQAGKYLSDQADLPDSQGMIQEMVDAIVSLYDDGDATPLDFVIIIDTAVETYMSRYGLHLDNAKLFAHVYHDVLENIVKTMEEINSPAKALHVLAMGSEQILRLFTTNFSDDMVLLFKVFTDATKKVAKLKSE